MSTPNLGLETVPSNSLQPSIPLNDALQLIDALLHLTIVDKDLAKPPTTTAADSGKRWIIAASPTDAWEGKEKHIALCTGANLWRFIQPKDGMRAWVSDETKEYRYQSDAWKAM